MADEIKIKILSVFYKSPLGCKYFQIDANVNLKHKVFMIKTDN